MPRKKLGRMRVPPPDEQTARRYLLWMPGKRLYEQPHSFPEISSPTLFGNRRPLEIEVGCGTGEFLCHLASQNPDANFVGFDIHKKSLYKAVRTAASQDLPNILFVSADFRLVYPLLPDSSLRAIHLRFPDPGMKPRERKKRLFDRRLLDESFRSLQSSGCLLVVTDHREYFEEMLALARRDGRWLISNGVKKPSPDEERPVSRFERLWMSRGRPAFWLTLQKPPRESAHAR
ncbi:tRNA (guanosine(46)-N7)-methyltransferase TrmB [Rubrobacter calidifluminis]|uniref:tRNA (guanosine(46)-N7)-methyltransferase TrmB n=1 Tax=Rubrobacter calidifluminis TaxID=1392640 RepID=UPI00235E6235|nr:tRNA (guanosine(46)-N7)-methyltransferase TrmB [Rubrobacter calidifluminis]